MKEVLEIFTGALVVAIPVMAILGLAKIFIILFKILAKIGAFLFAIYLLISFSCSMIKKKSHKKSPVQYYDYTIPQNNGTRMG